MVDGITVEYPEIPCDNALEMHDRHVGAAARTWIFVDPWLSAGVKKALLSRALLLSKTLLLSCVVLFSSWKLWIQEPKSAFSLPSESYRLNAK